MVIVMDIELIKNYNYFSSQLLVLTIFKKFVFPKFFPPNFVMQYLFDKITTIN